MADLTKTVSNSIRCFGGGPPTLWGQAVSNATMVWGTSKWGEGSRDYINPVWKVFGNSIVNTSSVGLVSITYRTVSNSVTTVNSFLGAAGFYLSMSNAFAPTSETSSESLKSGIWSYVFISDTTDAENRSTSTYTSGAAATGSWTSASVTSTSWS